MTSRAPEEYALADDAVLVSEDGEVLLAKPKVVEAHQPGKGPTFTRVEMTDRCLFGDHAACDPIAGISRRVGFQVVGFGVDDERRSAATEDRVAVGPEVHP